MSNRMGIQLTSGVANSIGGIMAWFGLSSGLYALASGGILDGLVEILIALAIGAFLLSGKLATAATGREVPKLLIGFFLLITIIISSFRLTELFVIDLEFLGELRLPELIRVVSTVVFVVLVGIFLWQLAKSRSKKRPA